MRSRLRLFALVGLVATIVDIGLVVALRERGLVVADVVALSAASAVSYLGNRSVTFRGDRTARWVRRPSLFAGVAVVAGVVDVSLLTIVVSLGAAVPLAKVLVIPVAAAVRWTAYRRVLFAEVRRELSQHHDRPPVGGEPRLSVVVPAYREEGLIGESVAALRAAVETRLTPDEFEIVVVDDGSPDGTATAAAAAGARVIAQPENRGKGAAVRAGVLGAEGRSVVFTDADLAYPPELVLDVMDRIEAGWDVVVGSRRHEDTNTLVRARRLRELGGRFINLLTHLVLLGAFHDTQCGIKGFRRDIGVAIFERTRIDGFAFDVEVFVMAEQDRLSLTEIPVSVTNRAGSSVRLVGDTVGLLADLVRIRRWAGSGRYRPDERQRRVLGARAAQRP